MSRRIDIELTSESGGTWTWRAAGAKQPKGTVEADLVPHGSKVGDVVRAEVESGIDGLDVVALTLKTAREEQADPNRIEVIGAPQRGPDVSVTLAPGSRRRSERGRDERGGERRPRRGPRTEGEPGRGDGPGRRRPAERPDRGDRADRSDRADRPDRSDRTDRTGRVERAGRGSRDEERTGRRGRDDERGPRGDRPGAARRDRRPTVSATHRNALLATLGPERLPVAEQLLRGGIPAVRQAIEEQNSKAKALGGSPVNAEPLLALAEELVPAVNLATWKDRATSAQAAGRELRLRELRAVVAASRTVTLDEEGRALARALRESLDQRVTALREEWVGRLTNALDEQRVVDAVRLAGRPPEPATRLPAELAVRVSEAAGTAMTAQTETGAWLELLDAVLETPVRRTVKPQGIPDDPTAQGAARAAAGSVPALARLLGIRIPPPPPVKRPSRAPVSGAAGGGRAAAL